MLKIDHANTSSSLSSRQGPDTPCHILRPLNPTVEAEEGMQPSENYSLSRDVWHILLFQ